jgi:hypothetical protein
MAEATILLNTAFFVQITVVMKISLFALLLSFSLLVSCKNESILGDKTLPVITIEAPIVNDHYNTGDSILIKGNIKDINTLEQTAIHITSIFDNNEFIHLHYGLLNSNTWNFEVKQKVTHTVHTDYEIEIEGIDDAGNKERKTVTVIIN